MKIHADFGLFAAKNFDATQYVASPSSGVSRFMLDRVGDERARATTIVQYQPNSKFPQHTHIGGEEFLVLDGTFKDEFGAFPAFTYVRNPIGSKHAPWVDDDGCTIFVKLLQMADTGEAPTPLYVDLDKGKEKRGKVTGCGTVLDLCKNKETGEAVEMHWLNADVVFPTDSLGINGGEELFVMKGSLHLGTEQYSKWGWLRFPVAFVGDRSQLRTGSDGAIVFRKTGHLTTKALSMEKIQCN